MLCGQCRGKIPHARVEFRLATLELSGGISPITSHNVLTMLDYATPALWLVIGEIPPDNPRIDEEENRKRQPGLYSRSTIYWLEMFYWLLLSKLSVSNSRSHHAQ